MATTVIMPRQGQSVESCILTSWNKNEGDAVAIGDILFSYETDKAAFEEEAKAAGVLLKQLVQEGDDVPCLADVCIIGEAGELAEDDSTASPTLFDKEGASAEAGVLPGAPSADVSQDDTPPVYQNTPRPEGGTLFSKEGEDSARTPVSPRAKNLAKARRVPLTAVTPSGPDGRIIERDVLAAIAGGAHTRYESSVEGGIESAPEQSSPGLRAGGATSSTAGTNSMQTAIESPRPAAAQPPGYRDQPLSNIRKVIAKAMYASLQNTAQLTLNGSFDMTQVLALRKQLKAGVKDVNITINDIIMFAVSRVLPNHPELNAHFMGDSMRYFDAVNLAFAVDTPRGLLVPVIFGADSMSLKELSVKSKELAESAQSGTISPDLITGGSFTVSNLGTFGIEHFTPVLNPPQTGILGVNTVVQRVRECENGLEAYPCMTLSITFDHRAIDGAPTARFLKELCESLENVTCLLAQ